ncbi:MAG: hypothetical protein JO125_17045 [Chloroflexi bacterium]|nr:hypothetical protein [Ktedonobacteraceae bacterium]MBV8821976.1 hypothetical protein [Ktedonobacteraceae bacterium]MBV9020176.1 hypothetical protein [Ktedonobacteraceae bacterium]MBV9709102.1 hypothetical protein [Chloroflexota bacterium]
MPKKSATARSGTQRSKAKGHKNIELVRPVSEKPRAEAVETTTPEVVNASTTMAAQTHTVAGRSTAQKSQKGRVEKSTTAPEAATTPSTVGTEPAPKGSAAARLAARRQTAQKVQRSGPALITPEHYSYVRKDLVFIATLATIMFLVIIILHFVPGIGS